MFHGRRVQTLTTSLHSIETAERHVENGFDALDALEVLLGATSPAAAFKPLGARADSPPSPSQERPRLGHSMPVTFLSDMDMASDQSISQTTSLRADSLQLTRRGLVLCALPLTMPSAGFAAEVVTEPRPVGAADMIANSGPAALADNTNGTRPGIATGAVNDTGAPAAEGIANPRPPAQLRKEVIDKKLSQRLVNRYILLRPGETTFEAAAMVDSDPINKMSKDRGLTKKGRAQVSASAKELKRLGIMPYVFFDIGARASQTAYILKEELGISENNMQPEYLFLEARGWGEWDGAELKEATARMREIDNNDINGIPEASDEGAPTDSLNDVFCRMRNTILKCENSYAGADIVIIGGDSSVLSVFAAAACEVDLQDHFHFELPQGGFYYLPEIQRDVKAGNFSDAELFEPTLESVEAGRAELRRIGPKLFEAKGAGWWVIGGERR